LEIARAVQPPEYEDLRAELRTLRKRGLRALRELNLEALGHAARLFYGHALVDVAAGIEAMLRSALNRLDDDDYGHSASLLFGLVQGTRTASPRVRREKAAAALDRKYETFRKTYEPAMLGEIASQMLQLILERQARRPGLGPLATSRRQTLDLADAVPPLDADLEAAALQNLVSQYVPGEGFPSQMYGENSYSMASTGICAYVACGSSAITADERRTVLAFICDSIRDDGTLPTHQYQGEWIETTWAAGQCLLALGVAPDLVNAMKARGLALTLLRYQSENGWSLRPDQESQFEPLLSLYPLLALSRARDLGWVTRDELADCLRRLREPLLEDLRRERTHPARRLIAEYEFDVVTATLGEREDVVERLRATSRRAAASLAAPENYSDLSGYTVLGRDQPLWYARVWRPAVYLVARHIYPLPSPITVLLGAELVETYLSEQMGWRPDTANGADPSAPPFTWTTALGLLATARLRSDLLELGVDGSELQRMVADVRRFAWR
jgi:hypothetical protein